MLENDWAPAHGELGAGAGSAKRGGIEGVQKMGQDVVALGVGDLWLLSLPLNTPFSDLFVLLLISREHVQLLEVASANKMKYFLNFYIGDQE